MDNRDGVFFVFFGYASKLLRLVLSIAAKLPYETPWPTLIGRCDTLSNGVFSQDVHILRLHPYGMLLVAKHIPYGSKHLRGPRIDCCNTSEYLRIIHSRTKSRLIVAIQVSIGE